MPVNPREMIISAGRRFPVRIRIAVPPDGRGRRHPQNTAWHDENCSADGWAMTPAGTRGVLNDALSMYFSGMQHWRAHSSPGGALGRRSRRVAACFRCARTSRSRGLDGSCTGRHDGGEIASASGTRDHRWPVMTWAWTPAGDLTGCGKSPASTSAAQHIVR